MNDQYNDDSEGFDPNAHKPDPNQKSSDFLERPGKFLVALTWMSELAENKNGKLNARFKVEVIAEARRDGVDDTDAGLIFFDNIYFVPTTYQRLGALCAAMGVNEAFKFTDQQVKRALLFRPFKTSVKVESSDGRKFAKLGFVEPSVTSEERAAMDQWVVDAAERRAADSAAGGASNEFGGDDGAPMPDDDDLDDMTGF